MSSARRTDMLMVAVGIGLVILDQLTKRWILDYFAADPTRPPIPLLGHVLDLEYVQNTGVAFSMLEGQTVLFVFVVLAVAVIGTLYWRTRDTASAALKVAFGLILGGAAGNNLIDRLTRGYVVDFIHFHIDPVFNFAVFNVADSGITVGVFLLAFLLWRGSAQTTSDRAPQSSGSRSASASSSAAATAEAGAPGGGEATPRVRNRSVGDR